MHSAESLVPCFIGQSCRTFQVKDLAVVAIHFYFRSEMLKLKYEIVEGAIPVADYNSFIVVAKGSNPNESTVTWVGRFYRVYKLNPPIPAGQDDETAIKAVTEIYDAGLPGLKKLAEAK